MPISAIIELLVQTLPLLLNDAGALASTLAAGNAAVVAAQANGGTVPAAEWAALDTLRAQAEAAWTTATAP